MTRKEFRIQRALGTLDWDVDVPVPIILHEGMLYGGKKSIRCMVISIEDQGDSIYAKIQYPEDKGKGWCIVAYPKEGNACNLVLDTIEGQLE